MMFWKDELTHNLVFMLTFIYVKHRPDLSTLHEVCDILHFKFQLKKFITQCGCSRVIRPLLGSFSWRAEPRESNIKS